MDDYINFQTFAYNTYINIHKTFNDHFTLLHQKELLFNSYNKYYFNDKHTYYIPYKLMYWSYFDEIMLQEYYFNQYSIKNSNKYLEIYNIIALEYVKNFNFNKAKKYYLYGIKNLYSICMNNLAIMYHCYINEDIDENDEIDEISDINKKSVNLFVFDTKQICDKTALVAEKYYIMAYTNGNITAYGNLAFLYKALNKNCNLIAHYYHKYAMHTCSYKFLSNFLNKNYDKINIIALIKNDKKLIFNINVKYEKYMIILHCYFHDDLDSLRIYNITINEYNIFVKVITKAQVKYKNMYHKNVL